MWLLAWFSFSSCPAVSAASAVPVVTSTAAAAKYWAVSAAATDLKAILQQVGGNRTYTSLMLLQLEGGNQTKPISSYKMKTHHCSLKL